MKSVCQGIIQPKKIGFQAVKLVNCGSSTVSQKDSFQADWDLNKKLQIIFSNVQLLPFLVDAETSTKKDRLAPVNRQKNDNSVQDTLSVFLEL